MIVGAADIDSLPEFAMVSGRFDPLHPGHLGYFERAASVGLPVLCNVSSDEEVASKHAPILTQDERAVVIDALRPISFVYLARGTTRDSLATLRPKVFVKGSDWEGRLPPEELEVCERNGTELVFLDTITHSSTDIVKRFLDAHRQWSEQRLVGQQ
jgi:cytidyltransferase-like protein